MKMAQNGVVTLVLFLGPVVAGLAWLLLLRPLDAGVVAAEQAWQQEEATQNEVASHADELAGGHLIEAMEQVEWLRDRLRPGAGAAFVEAVGRAAAQLGVGAVEVQRPGTENDPTTGLRLERVALRVVAPYPKIAALWHLLEARQETASVTTLSLSRYGDQVAAIFEVALPVNLGATP